MSLETNIKALSSLKIFAELDPDALRLIAFASETLTLSAGDVLFREGDESDGGYVIISGTIRIDSMNSTIESGTILGPGALVGELALLISYLYSVTAIARENSILLKIPRALFLRVLQELPANAQNLQHVLGAEIASFMKALAKTRNVLLGEE